MPNLFKVLFVSQPTGDGNFVTGGPDEVKRDWKRQKKERGCLENVT